MLQPVRFPIPPLFPPPGETTEETDQGQLAGAGRGLKILPMMIITAAYDPTHILPFHPVVISWSSSQIVKPKLP